MKWAMKSQRTMKLSKTKTTVVDWLGISEEEFGKRKKVGFCIKCGKDAVTPYGLLCIGHKIAYHRWRNKIERKGGEN